MDFNQRISIACDRIPAGKVSTYGRLALLCGKPHGARQAGRALSRSVSDTAHRVVNSRGFLSGADAFGLEGTQKALLEGEGVYVSEEKTVDLKTYGWQPTEEEEDQLESLFFDLGI